jgi:hypothetical protein
VKSCCVRCGREAVNPTLPQVLEALRFALRATDDKKDQIALTRIRALIEGSRPRLPDLCLDCRTLPAGWTLYSVLDAGKPDADRDFGARRDDKRAHCFGVRDTNGDKRFLRAHLAHGEKLPMGWKRDQIFEPDQLAEAAAWCDERLRALDALHFQEGIEQ